jgi:hypothetical protein
MSCGIMLRLQPMKDGIIVFSARHSRQSFRLSGGGMSLDHAIDEVSC